MQTDFSNIREYFPNKTLVSIYTENEVELQDSDVVVIDDWIAIQYITFDEESDYIIRTTVSDFIEWSRLLNILSVDFSSLYIYFVNMIKDNERPIIDAIREQFGPRILILNIE